MLNFEPITIESRERIQPFLDEWALEQSDTSFGSMYIWRKGYDIQYAIDDMALYVRVRDGDKPYMLKPPLLADKDADMRRALEVCEDYFKSQGMRPHYGSVSEHQRQAMEKAWPGRYEYFELRDFFDYVYRAPDLIQLSGSKYHAKRNHISKFRSFNEFEYIEYSPEHYGECCELYGQWLSEKDMSSPGIALERDAVMSALRDASAIGLTGAMMRVNGRIEAFTLASRLKNDMAVVHIEKANSSIQGLYPMINQQFVEHALSDVAWINREEDMGIPGIRKAKSSYHPARMVVKMGAVLKA